MGKVNEQKGLTLKQLIVESYGCSEKIVSDLKAGLQRDFTIREACVYAGISHDTYYNWLKKSDEFAHEMELAQQYMSHKAKQVIMNAIDANDKDSAKWWLERRRKENYSTKVETQNTNLNVDSEVLNDEERQNILDAFREARSEEASSGE